MYTVYYIKFAVFFLFSNSMDYLSAGSSNTIFVSNIENKILKTWFRTERAHICVLVSLVHVSIWFDIKPKPFCQMWIFHIIHTQKNNRQSLCVYYTLSRKKWNFSHILFQSTDGLKMIGNYAKSLSNQISVILNFWI